MCELDAATTLVCHVLCNEMAILRWKVAEFSGPKIFLSAADVKPLAERYNRR